MSNKYQALFDSVMRSLSRIIEYANFYEETLDKYERATGHITDWRRKTERFIETDLSPQDKAASIAKALPVAILSMLLGFGIIRFFIYLGSVIKGSGGTIIEGVGFLIGMTSALMLVQVFKGTVLVPSLLGYPRKRLAKNALSSGQIKEEEYNALIGSGLRWLGDNLYPNTLRARIGKMYRKHLHNQYKKLKEYVECYGCPTEHRQYYEDTGDIELAIEYLRTYYAVKATKTQYARALGKAAKPVLAMTAIAGIATIGATLGIAKLARGKYIGINAAGEKVWEGNFPGGIM